MRKTSKQQLAQSIKWVAEHPAEYDWLVSRAFKTYRVEGRIVRINPLVESLRDAYRVHVPNAVKPYLARRIERETGILFTRSKSKIDYLMEGEDDD